MRAQEINLAAAEFEREHLAGEGSAGRTPSTRSPAGAAPPPGQPPPPPAREAMPPGIPSRRPPVPVRKRSLPSLPSPRSRIGTPSVPASRKPTAAPWDPNQFASEPLPRFSSSAPPGAPSSRPPRGKPPSLPPTAASSRRSKPIDFAGGGGASDVQDLHPVEIEEAEFGYSYRTSSPEIDVSEAGMDSLDDDLLQELAGMPEEQAVPSSRQSRFTSSRPPPSLPTPAPRSLPPDGLFESAEAKGEREPALEDFDGDEEEPTAPASQGPTTIGSSRSDFDSRSLPHGLRGGPALRSRPPGPVPEPRRRPRPVPPPTGTPTSSREGVRRFSSRPPPSAGVPPPSTGVPLSQGAAGPTGTSVAPAGTSSSRLRLPSRSEGSGPIEPPPTTPAPQTRLSAEPVTGAEEVRPRRRFASKRPALPAPVREVEPPLPTRSEDSLPDLASVLPAGSTRPSVSPPSVEPVSDQIAAPEHSADEEDTSRPGPLPPSEAPPHTGPPAIGGVLLSEVRGLQDLPEEAQRLLADTAQLEKLAAGEEVSFFAVALVLRGGVHIMPAISDASCSYASSGEVVFTAGTLADGVELRVSAGEENTRVAIWDRQAFEAATAGCPWVAEELRLIADSFQALAGVAVGPLGERLDDSLRAMITERCEVLTLGPGEIIVEQGKPMSGMHIVGGGRVELVWLDGSGEEVQATLGPGDFLFGPEILAAAPAPCTARAGRGGALLLFANRHTAHELMVSVPPLLEIFAR